MKETPPRGPLEADLEGESCERDSEPTAHVLRMQEYVVFIPKYRKKVTYKGLRRHLGDVVHELASQRESRIEEGHLMCDHVHLLISIPPKYSVAQVMGFLKGKSAIHIARVCSGRRRNFSGQSFRARGFFVSTVGSDEQTVRKYIQNQEAEDRRLEQLQLPLPPLAAHTLSPP